MTTNGDPDPLVTGPQSATYSCPDNSRTRPWISRDKIEVFFTAVIAFATASYAVVSCNELSTMRTSIERAERAWVAPLPIKITEVKDKLPIFSLPYQNSGKSPAFNSDVIGKTATGGPIPENDACKLTKRANGGPVIYPGVTYITTFQNINAAIAKQIEAARTGGAIFYMLGCLRYDDAFGNQRFSKFCQLFVPEENVFKFCDGGNDAS